MTERDFSRYLISRIKFVVIMLVVLFMTGLMFSGNGHDQGSHAGSIARISASTPPVDSIQVRIDLPAILAAIIVLALLTNVVMHLRRVYATSHGDDSVLSEGSRKHWIGYMSRSLVFSIVLIGFVIHAVSIVFSKFTVLLAFIVCWILIFNSALMIDGMTTLRRLRKLEERQQKMLACKHRSDPGKPV